MTASTFISICRVAWDYKKGTDVVFLKFLPTEKITVCMTAMKSYREISLNSNNSQSSDDSLATCKHRFTQLRKSASHKLRQKLCQLRFPKTPQPVASRTPLCTPTNASKPPSKPPIYPPTEHTSRVPICRSLAEPDQLHFRTPEKRRAQI